MCYSGKCKYEDHMGNCILPSGSSCKNENMEDILIYEKNMIKPIRFLKSKCFPITLIVTTTEVNDKEMGYKGFITTITDDQEKQIAEFKHADLRARLLWVDGYFNCYRMLSSRKVINPYEIR
jgi:hypothetical protein